MGLRYVLVLAAVLLMRADACRTIAHAILE